MRINQVIKVLLVVIGAIITIRKTNILSFMEHKEVKRSWFDRLIGRNKRYDDIVKVRSQIRKINSKYISSERSPFVRPSMGDIDFRKISELNSKVIIDEHQFVSTFGADVLHNRFIDVRDELVDMLKGKIDLSDILSEIRDEKIKSLGI